MRSINLHNYEEFYLDYIEENLSAELTAQLLIFLENNPDIKTELESFEMISFNPSENEVIEKGPLKKYIDEQNIDHFIIASLEGANDDYDQKELDQYLEQSNEAKKLSNRYNKTILKASSIQYPEKEKLKKRGVIVYYLVPMIAAAAALLIFFLVYNSNETNDLENAISTIQEDNNLDTNSNNQIEKSIVREEPTPQTTQEPQVVVRANESIVIKKASINVLSDQPESNNNNLIEIETKDSITEDNIIIVQQPESLLIDTILQPNLIVNQDTIHLLPEIIPDTESLVINETPKKKTKSSEVLTVGGWAKKMIRKKIFKQKKPTADNITKDEIVTAAVTRIDEETSADANYKKDEKRSSFGITIGKFEFYRSKSR